MFKSDIQDLLNKKEIYTKEDLIKLADIVCECKNIKLDSIEFNNNGPQFDFMENKLILSENSCAEWFIDEINNFKKCEDLRYMNNKGELLQNLNASYSILNQTFINNVLALTVLHELRHSQQQKMIDETYTKCDPVLLKNLIISYSKQTPFMAMAYHDKLYHEFDANINSILELSNYSLDEKTIRYFAYKILLPYTNKRGNEFLSPLDNNLNSFGDKIDCKSFKAQVKYIEKNIYTPKNDILLGTKLESGILENFDACYQGKSKILFK